MSTVDSETAPRVSMNGAVITYIKFPTSQSMPDDLLEHLALRRRFDVGQDPGPWSASTRTEEEGTESLLLSRRLEELYLLADYRRSPDASDGGAFTLVKLSLQGDHPLARCANTFRSRALCRGGDCLFCYPNQTKRTLPSDPDVPGIRVNWRFGTVASLVIDPSSKATLPLGLQWRDTWKSVEERMGPTLEGDPEIYFHGGRATLDFDKGTGRLAQVTLDGRYMRDPICEGTAAPSRPTVGCLEGDCRDGAGFRRFSDGWAWRGTFVDGSPDGDGCLYSPTGLMKAPPPAAFKHIKDGRQSDPKGRVCCDGRCSDDKEVRPPGWVDFGAASVPETQRTAVAREDRAATKATAGELGTRSKAAILALQSVVVEWSKASNHLQHSLTGGVNDRPPVIAACRTFLGQLERKNDDLVAVLRDVEVLSVKLQHPAWTRDIKTAIQLGEQLGRDIDKQQRALPANDLDALLWEDEKVRSYVRAADRLALLAGQHSKQHLSLLEAPPR